MVIDQVARSKSRYPDGTSVAAGSGGLTRGRPSARGTRGECVAGPMKEGRKQDEAAE